MSRHMPDEIFLRQVLREQEMQRKLGLDRHIQDLATIQRMQEALLPPRMGQQIIDNVPRSILEPTGNKLASLIDSVDRIQSPISALRSASSRQFEEFLRMEERYRKRYADHFRGFDSSLNNYLPSESALRSTIASLLPEQSETNLIHQSLEGMVGLMSLEKIIRESPFGGGSRSALQHLIGNWDRTQLPASAFEDWEARQKFYFDRGFDARLTTFPAGIFDNALSQSGLFYPKTEIPRSGHSLEDADANSEEQIVKNRMLRAYEQLNDLETEIRDILSEAMIERFGPKWVKQRVPGAMNQAWEEKRQTALGKGEAERPILSYADFTDYEGIITRKDNWNDLFGPVFVNKMDVQISFQRLYPIRICTMHARPLTNEDLLLLSVEATRILQSLKKLKPKTKGR